MNALGVSVGDAPRGAPQLQGQGDVDRPATVLRAEPFVSLPIAERAAHVRQPALSGGL